MLKKDELAKPNSCLSRAEDDEPLFVLRASDPLAANLVRDWRRRYITNKSRHGEMTQRQLDKAHEALRCADAMDSWIRSHSPETGESL